MATELCAGRALVDGAVRVSESVFARIRIVPDPCQTLREAMLVLSMCAAHDQFLLVWYMFATLAITYRVMVSPATHNLLLQVQEWSESGRGQ